MARRSSLPLRVLGRVCATKRTLPDARRRQWSSTVFMILGLLLRPVRRQTPAGVAEHRANDRDLALELVGDAHDRHLGNRGWLEMLSSISRVPRR